MARGWTAGGNAYPALMRPQRVDEVDVRLLRAMSPRELGGTGFHPDALRSPRLAREVGLSVNAVKARVEGLLEAGVLRGFHVLPNLPALGMGGGAYYVQPRNRAAADAILRELEARHRLIRASGFATGAFCIELAHAGDAERRDILQLIEAGSTVAPRQFLDFSTEAKRSFTPLDMRIVKALRPDALAAPTDIADQVGVSARTVKRRTAALVEDGLFHAIPRLDASRASGMLLVEMLFQFNAGQDKKGRAALLRAFEREHVYAYEPATPSIGHFSMLAYARTTGEVDALRRRAEELPEIASAEALFYASSEDHSAWLDDLLADGSPEPGGVAVQGRQRDGAQP